MTQAVLFLIDNSDFSINGDYIPTRLEAQKISVERLARFFFHQSPTTEIGFGTSSKSDSCIQVSLLEKQEMRRIETELDEIKISGEQLDIFNSVRRSFFALKRCAPENATHKRIIMFIGAPTNINNQDDVEKFVNLIYRENVSIDFIVFGQENHDNIKAIAEKLGNEKSNFLSIPPKCYSMSDMVLKEFQKGTSTSHNGYEEDDDPELALALKMSMMDSIATDDINNKIPHPTLNDDEDPELAEAIRLSLLESNNQNKDNGKDKNKNSTFENDGMTYDK